MPDNDKNVMTPESENYANKYFRLSNEAISVIQKVKKDFSFSAERDALEYIIRTSAYADMSEVIANNVASILRKELARIRGSSQGAENNTTLLLDFVNTWLFNHDLGPCIPVAVSMHDVIETSNELLGKRLASLKQRADEKKAKRPAANAANRRIAKRQNDGKNQTSSL